MTFRITQGMLYARALTDVQRGLYRYSQLQQQIASGRRISRPSDDPAAALRLLPLRRDLRDLDQLSNNVVLARETLDISASSLEDASAILQRVRELTTQAANGTLNDTGRQSIGAEVEQLIGQVLSIANSRRGDRFLFGGTESGQPPFEQVTEGGRTRVVYRGNHDTLDIDVAPGVSTALNVAGDGVFLARNRTATTLSTAFGSPTTGAQAVGFGDNGIGFGRLDITYAGLTSNAPPTVSQGAGVSNALGDLGYVFDTSPDTLSIDGGPRLAIPTTDTTFTTLDGREISLSVSGVPATLTGTFTAAANLSIDDGATVQRVESFVANSIPVVDAMGTVLYINTENLAQTGSEDVKYNGTFDIFTTLAELSNLLRNEEDLPPNIVRDRVAGLLAEVDTAHDAVLDGLRELGFRSASMDVLQNRVEGLRISQTESMSLIEDTDLAEAILELQRQDLSYQAALQISARVIQSSLQGFLR